MNYIENNKNWWKYLKTNPFIIFFGFHEFENFKRFFTTVFVNQMYWFLDTCLSRWCFWMFLWDWVVNTRNKCEWESFWKTCLIHPEIVWKYFICLWSLGWDEVTTLHEFAKLFQKSMMDFFVRYKLLMILLFFLHKLLNIFSRRGPADKFKKKNFYNVLSS